MFSAFIVDDEAMARGNLVDALQQHERWPAPKTFSSGKQLVQAVVAHKPDVVFLDIQMPGEDGMTVARKLLELPDAPLLVFVTAFSEYAVAAFELYAVDYLLKPFSDERLALCIAKLEHTLDHDVAHQRARTAQSAWAQTNPLDRLIIKSTTSVRIIDVAQIHWIAANGNYVDIHHADGKHLLRTSLKQVLSSLPEPDFVQIHRSHIVRFDLIRELKSQDNERSIAVLATDDAVPDGKSYRQGLLALLCG